MSTTDNSGTIHFRKSGNIHSFNLYAYRHSGECEDLEIVVTGNTWRAFLSDRFDSEVEKTELIGSMCGPFRSQIQSELEKRGLNLTEKQ